MTFGEPSLFSIESEITVAYERLSFRALGYFVLQIGGRSYGVRASDATLLAGTLDEVGNRISDRGLHVAPFSNEQDAGNVADEYLAGLYGPIHEGSLFFGMPRTGFSELVYSNHLIWAPDGSEAFDDNSHVLHFDVGDRVRLIAFKGNERYTHVPNTLSDTWLSADVFYSVLRAWRHWFEEEWASKAKTAE